MKRLWLLALAFPALWIWSLVTHPWAWAFGIGIHPYPGPQTPWTYQLYSGFLPALTVVSLLTLLGAAWRHINCQHDGCWRFGRHKVNGTPWCDTHHEEARTQRTVEDLLTEIIGLLRGLQPGKP